MKLPLLHPIGWFRRIACSALLVSTASLVSAATPPNIIIIMADDLGSADVGYSDYSQSDVTTPNIDALRAQGTNFPVGYSTGNVCSPSRMGLILGAYPNRVGLVNSNTVSGAGIPSTSVTIAQRLKNLGYKTGMIGKWHLGEDPNANSPLDRGFDEALFFKAGGKTPYFFTPENYPGLDKAYEIFDGRTVLTPDNSYTTDLWADRAIKFIEDSKTQKFFLYLSFNAVHSDLHSPPDGLGETLIDREKLVRMGQYMDRRIGDILKKLDDLNLRNNTLIFFLSDNGGAIGDYSSAATMQSDNRPLREGKHYDYEGGIRVPFLVSWPAGGVLKNATNTTSVINIDIGPTMVAAAGGTDFTGMDGANLLPILTNPMNTLPARTLYWSSGSDKADAVYEDGGEAWSAVKGKNGYKLVVEKFDIHVFDLKSDISEAAELDLTVSANKAIMVDLYRQLIQWQMEMPHINGTEGVFEPKKPRYKDAWTFYFPMTTTNDLATYEVLEAVEKSVAKNDVYQPYVIARYSQGNAVFDHLVQPTVTWSLISAIGGSIDAATGKFTAGNTDGYVVLKAEADFFRKEDADLRHFSSYQLVKVGNGGTPPVNIAPTFSSASFTKANGSVGVVYSGTIADKASDANANDALIFSKVLGPEWLRVGEDGKLGGTPTPTDVGLNTWTVRVADASGAWVTAVLTITVTPPESLVTVTFPNDLLANTAYSAGTLTLNFTVDAVGYVTMDATSTGVAGVVSAANLWDGPVGIVTTPSLYNTSFSLTLTGSGGGLRLSSNGSGGLGVSGLTGVIQDSTRIDRPGVESLNAVAAINGAKIQFKSLQWTNRANTTVDMKATAPGVSLTRSLGTLTGAWDVSANSVSIGNTETLSLGTVDLGDVLDGYALAGFTFDVVSSGGVVKPYDTWTASYGLSGAAAGQLADPDADGVKNVLEYALGGNPTSAADANSIQPQVSSINVGGTPYIQYVYSRRNDAATRGMTYALETTDDLAGTWTNIGTTAEISSVTKDAAFNTVTNRIAISGVSKKFVRLKVTTN